MTRNSTFFPSVNIGPAFTFRSYEAFTSHTVYKGSPRPDESEHPGIPPGRKRAAGERAAVGLFFLGIYAALAGGFGYERVLEDRFLERSMLSRCAPYFLSFLSYSDERTGSPSCKSSAFSLAPNTTPAGASRAFASSFSIQAYS